MAVWLPGFWFRCPLFLSLVWSSTGPSSSVWNKREGYSHPLLPHNHREKARSLFLLRAMLALVCSQPLLYWAMFFWYLICPAFLLAHIAQNNGYYCDISHVHIMYFDSISLPSLLPFTPPPVWLCSSCLITPLHRMFWMSLFVLYFPLMRENRPELPSWVWLISLHMSTFSSIFLAMAWFSLLCC